MFFNRYDSDEFAKIKKEGIQHKSMLEDVENMKFSSSPSPTVGIIGAGMSGLYAGLLLKQLNINFQIFERDENRVGGRVFTHYFSNEPYDYSEIGAMRLPHLPEFGLVFEVIDNLNKLNVDNPDYQLRLIKYFMGDGK